MKDKWRMNIWQLCGDVLLQLQIPTSGYNEITLLSVSPETRVLTLLLVPHDNTAFQSITTTNKGRRTVLDVFDAVMSRKSSLLLLLGKLVVHRKSTGSRKMWLSMIEHGHYFCMWVFTPWLWVSFPQVKRLCTLYTPEKSIGWDYKMTPHMHIRDPVVHVRVWFIMETLPKNKSKNSTHRWLGSATLS